MNEPVILPSRCGHVALAGAPNVGKSSLLNRLVRAHLAIVSPKAQSTRLPVLGLVSDETTQIVFHDLPGLLDPQYPLQSRMRAAGLAELARVDLVLHLHQVSAGPAPEFWALAGAAPRSIPILPIYTKADLANSREVAQLPAGSLAVSAETGAGLEALLTAVRHHLPARPFEFEADDLGTQPLRFFVTEYLREAAFQVLEDEVPYGVAAEVEEFRENAAPVYIRVTLLVERESQKGIVIGKGGRTLKAIGQHARQRLEALLDAQVFLDLWVKVLPNWRRDATALDRLGFPSELPPR